VQLNHNKCRAVTFVFSSKSALQAFLRLSLLYFLHPCCATPSPPPLVLPSPSRFVPSLFPPSTRPSDVSRFTQARAGSTLAAGFPRISSIDRVSESTASVRSAHSEVSTFASLPPSTAEPTLYVVSAYKLAYLQRRLLPHRSPSSPEMVLAPKLPTL